MSITIALPSLSFQLPDSIYWRGNRTQKGSVWEATCYLRVLGIETAAEASLSTVMKAGRFGRFHSQHSMSPHPHLSASTACVCLLLASSFIHLPTVPPWPLLPSLGEEWHAILQIACAWQAKCPPGLTVRCYDKGMILISGDDQDLLHALTL